MSVSPYPQLVLQSTFIVAVSLGGAGCASSQPVEPATTDFSGRFQGYGLRAPASPRLGPRPQEHPRKKAAYAGLGLRQNPEGVVVVRSPTGPVWRRRFQVSIDLARRSDRLHERSVTRRRRIRATAEIPCRRRHAASGLSPRPECRSLLGGPPRRPERRRAHHRNRARRCREMERHHRPGPAGRSRHSPGTGGRVRRPRSRQGRGARAPQSHPGQWTRCSQLCRSAAADVFSAPTRCLPSSMRSSVRFRSIASRPTSPRRFARSPSLNPCNRLSSRFTSSSCIPSIFRIFSRSPTSPSGCRRQDATISRSPPALSKGMRDDSAASSPELPQLPAADARKSASSSHCPLRCFRRSRSMSTELEQFAQEVSASPQPMPPELTERVSAAVEGPVLGAKLVDGELWVVGGDQSNRYNMDLIAAVFDVGGADVYAFSAPARGPYQIIIDQSGDDLYESNADLAGPAAAVFSVSVLDDRAGNDRYVSHHQGSIAAGLFGVAILIDEAGRRSVHQRHRAAQAGLKASASTAQGCSSIAPAMTATRRRSSPKASAAPAASASSSMPPATTPIRRTVRISPAGMTHRACSPA